MYNRPAVVIVRRRHHYIQRDKTTSIHKRKRLFDLRRDRHGESHSFKDLSLEGLREAINPNLSIFRRFFWGLLWLSMFCCCIAQCVTCLQVYFAGPTSMNIRYEKPKTITPPFVTFCPYDYHDKIPAVWKPLLHKEFGNVSYKTTHQLLEKTNMSVGALWNMSRFDFKNIIHDLWKSGFHGDAKDLKAMKYSGLNTVDGVCLSFKPIRDLPCSGNHAELHFAAEGELLDPKYGDTEYTVIFHSEAEVPMLRYYGPLVDGMFLPYAQVATMGLRLQEEIHVTSWRKPCISDVDFYQCKADCFEAIIRAECNLTKLCRLPFMKEDDTVPICSTADELKEVYLATQAAKEKMHDVEKHCRCYQPCKKVNFTPEFVHFSYGNGSQHIFEIYVIFPKCQVQVIEEVFTYRTPNFMSDVGGTLGLCLGMSVLSIVATLEVLALKLLRFMKLA